MVIKFVRYIISLILVTFVIMAVTFFIVILVPKGVFRSNYNSLIQDKFRILKTTNKPKIIVVSGSSSAFGLDQQMLEKATGYKVANLGLAAGFGPVFYTELTKANINKGDIVLLAYEDNWNLPDSFKNIGVDAVMTGIDDDIQMYRYIPLRIWPQIIGYLYDYAKLKIRVSRQPPQTGIYSREAFDSDTGQMIMDRDFIVHDYSHNMDTYGRIIIKDSDISPDVRTYLKKYKKYVESKGAEIYFVSPPRLKEAILCDCSRFYEVKANEEKEVGIPYISDPSSYFFPDCLMSNTYYHCNTRGEKYRTKLLIHDLYNAKVCDVKDIERYSFREDEKIIFENNFEQYLTKIKNDKTYSIFISLKKRYNKRDVSMQFLKQMNNLGIKLDSNKCFCAVVDHGCVEKIRAGYDVFESGYTKDGLFYCIKSGSNKERYYSSIIVNGVEYSRNEDGINIVVFNNKTKELVDTVSFDIYKDMICKR